jgi:putative oxidoreductase
MTSFPSDDRPRLENTLYVLARILISTIFIVAGLRKLLAYTATIGYFGRLGIPLPEFTVPLVIALEIGGGVALAFGWGTLVVAGALGTFTVVTALVGHQFWAVEPAQFTTQLNHFMKNIAMVGGFILVLLEELRRRYSGTISAKVMA